MDRKFSNKNLSQPTLEVSLLCEHVVELDEQNEELLSGGTSFSGEDRLLTRFPRGIDVAIADVNLIVPTYL